MKKNILLLFCSAITINGFSQSDVSGPLFGHQRTAGRFCGWAPGLGSVAGSLEVRNDFANQPINFFAGGNTAAFQRMTILGTTGFVGMGTPTPNRILQIHDGVDAQLQITNGTTGLAAGNGMLVGLFNNSNSAFIANQQNDALYFSTNGAAPGTVKMSILANGNTGIGVGFLNPLHLVDVRNGNINIGQGTGANVSGSPQAYMIGGNNILWHKGEVRNLFVGVNAGANTAGVAAFQNTYIGFNAGAANTTGQRNTVVGANAGESIQTGRFNTFIGTEAGRQLQNGDHNTFVGEQCGDRQITGTNNSYFGAHTAQGPIPNTGTGVGNNNTFLGAFSGSDITNGDGNTFSGVNAGIRCDDGNFNTFSGISSGNQCTTGSFNTMTGRQSGFFTTTGNDNVFMGNRAGFFNSTGSNNTYIGTNTGFVTAGVGLVGNTATNSTALGNGAQIRRSNVMILGNNLINVGIGLSNDISIAQGPQNKLEIDAGINGFNPSPSAAPGTSGLRFRDLHSGNTTIPNPGNGVLSVNSDGDVIYVPAGSTNIGNYCSAPSPNSLTGDYEIPLNLNNYYFTGNNVTKERVAVGIPCGSSLPSKFNVLLDKTLNSSSTIGNNAGYFQNINTGNAFNVGVKGEVTAAPGDNAGGYFRSISSAINAGNNGVYAIASNGGVTNRGGYFSATGGQDAIGVFGTASGGSNTNYAGYFNGDVYIAGSYR